MRGYVGVGVEVEVDVNVAILVTDQLPLLHHGVEEALDLLSSSKLLLHLVNLLLKLVHSLKLVLDSLFFYLGLHLLIFDFLLCS